jgi:hypothetical protein
MTALDVVYVKMAIGKELTRLVNVVGKGFTYARINPVP